MKTEALNALNSALQANGSEAVSDEGGVKLFQFEREDEDNEESKRAEGANRESGARNT